VSCKRSGSLVDSLLADHGLFHLEADLRWIDLTLVSWGDADTIVARATEQLAADADQVVLGVLHEGAQAGPIAVARELTDWLPLPSTGSPRAGGERR
jgi:hypothetical protein